MTTSIDRGSGNGVRAPAWASRQSPGFQRIRIGELLITAFYDGFVPVPADDLHGAPSAEIRRLLTEAYLPPQGDPRTAVIAFLVEQNGRRILIDAGSGDSLGPDTGCLAANLDAAGVDADDIDHVLLTHLHPDHIRCVATTTRSSTPDCRTTSTRRSADSSSRFDFYESTSGTIPWPSHR